MNDAEDNYRVADRSIAPGTRQWLSIPIPSAMGLDASHIDVFVACGKKPGPRVFVSAAIHGDELNGIEIIRRLIKRRAIRSLHGMLVCVPVVNLYGLANRSRYLPDRRDLNRCFPGSVTGSLAARMAHIFMNEVVKHCTHGIDLHTGSIHRQNLPQIRARLDDVETRAMAQAFGAPVMLQSELREGSLRGAAGDLGIPTIVYEGGEALRYNEFPVRAGLRGVLNVLAYLGMIKAPRQSPKPIKPVLTRRSSWVRAPSSGLLRQLVPLGKSVSVGETLAVVSTPGTLEETQLTSEYAGIVIGRTSIPLINEGDATLNIAIYADQDKADQVAGHVEAFQQQVDTVDVGWAQDQSG